jgi:uncharacterized repeat protein (TIGR03803 family)
LTPDGTPTPLDTLRDFSGLTQPTDGNFYGVTPEVIFRLTPSGQFTILHRFDDSEGFPPGHLVQGTDGNLYGTTTHGGSHEAGTFFKLAVGLTPPPTPSPTPTPTPTTRHFGNVSTRLSVGTGDNVLIVGFIITGDQAKEVIIRGIGPSLPLSGTLANPYLELHDATGTIASNDDWINSPDKQSIIDSKLAPGNDKESAILMTLNPGAYTAILSGENSTSGIALVEVYDLNAAVDSKLANISTRGLVQTGDNVMIGGIIIQSDTPTKIILRAIGPSLPLGGFLADPMLELHNPDGDLIFSNDNWRSDQEGDIVASKLQPSNDAEAAIVATLDPGAYTAIVRGVNNSIGIALVEAYDLQ